MVDEIEEDINYTTLLEKNILGDEKNLIKNYSKKNKKVRRF